MEIKDWRGNDMREGVTVTWAVNTGCDVRVREGVVMRIEKRLRYAWLADFDRERKDSDYVLKMKVKPNDGGKAVWLERIDRVTVVA